MGRQDRQVERQLTTARFPFAGRTDVSLRARCVEDGGQKIKVIRLRFPVSGRFQLARISVEARYSGRGQFKFGGGAGRRLSQMRCECCVADTTGAVAETSRKGEDEVPAPSAPFLLFLFGGDRSC